MAEFKVAEIFESINGEGILAGQLAVFIRFAGCNLSCSYCDTKWANSPDVCCKIMTEQQIYNYIKSTGIRNVTLTGGEPLLQKDITALLNLLSEDSSLHTEIETNGSVDIQHFSEITSPPSFTMDYKLPSSKMEKYMNTENFKYLSEKDTVKFVAGSKQDLETAYNIIQKYSLTEKCHIYISPVFNKIDPVEIVEFMKEKKLNNVNMQLQLHKFIWDPDKKGV